MKSVKKILKICLGVILIIGGIIGIFLPFVQGIAMIVAGIILIHPKWRKMFIKLLKKFVVKLGFMYKNLVNKNLY